MGNRNNYHNKLHQIRKDLEEVAFSGKPPDEETELDYWRDRCLSQKNTVLKALNKLERFQSEYVRGQNHDCLVISNGVAKAELHDLADRHSLENPGWLNLSEAVDFAVDCLRSFSPAANIDSKDLERIVKVITHQGYFEDPDPKVSLSVADLKVKYAYYSNKQSYRTAALTARCEWLAEELSRLINYGKDNEQ